jgi:hypothetical protein
VESPALRISNIVTGRQTKGSRVSYLLAPAGNGSQRAAPETVVLRRWRQRKMDGHTFAGSRLSSTIWRAVAFTFSDLVQKLETPSVDEIKERVQATQIAMKRRHLSLPSAEILRALLLDLGSQRLRRLIERHTSESHRGKSGVPDLYLFARSQLSPEKPAFIRFVEVKKPKEPTSKAQQEEIAFMRGLGLQARVLKLIERT